MILDIFQVLRSVDKILREVKVTPCIWELCPPCFIEIAVLDTGQLDKRSGKWLSAKQGFSMPKEGSSNTTVEETILESILASL